MPCSASNATDRRLNGRTVYVIVAATSIALHALQGRVNFATTLSCKLVGSGAKFVGRFAPGVPLGGDLKSKRFLLLGDFPDEPLDSFPCSGVECLSLGRSRPRNDRCR